MKSKKNEENAHAIVDYYKLHQNDRLATVRHFVDQGLNERTVRKVVKRWIDEGRIEYKKKSGPKKNALTKATLRKMRNKFIAKPSISNRKVAKILKISETSVRRGKSALNIKSKKKHSSPKYEKDQAQRCKTNAWKLYKRIVSGGVKKIVVIDDETYVPLDPSEIPGTQYYNEVEGHPLDITYKLKPKSKYVKKFLVWQAIASTGAVSEPFITKGTINRFVYRDECIKRTLKFIDSIADRNQVLFWPDMATSHYAKVVIEKLELEKIDYVSKSDNLPNCPQVRPIEKYWALCKDKYKAFPNECKDLATFKRRWKTLSEQVARNSGQMLFQNFTRRISQVGKFGVNSVL